MECTSNCLSKQHAKYLISAFTIENVETLKTIIKQRCSNPLRNSDILGRTILHICASVGRYDVLSWLCDEWKIANILQTKDKESGWTALHRALYYGHIDCAIIIYKLVQGWHAVDAEGHSPLDLLVLDSPRTKKMKLKQKRIAVAVLPFESGEPGELTLHSNDVIEIINTNRSGWAVGRLQETGAKGLFPINFVEEIEEVVAVEPCKRFNPNNNVYMWGNNVNFALGLGDSKNRTNPELVECLWQEKRNIKHCVVTKFHSVFLTVCGNIFTCGHGLGGRLGHEKEETVLNPKMINYFENIHCTAIDAAYSHTIVLDELGQAYTFGFNDFHQLGHHPPPPFCLCPKQINSKALKNKTIIGVSVGRFHSVIYTNHEIYTFGLNAGQLGHPKGVKLQTTPKLVSHLYKRDVNINMVVASDGATVCSLANGDLYLFQDYLCRKIALRMFDILCISVTGGMLQCTELETFNKPQPLRIVVLRNSGVVEVWRSGFNSLKMCYWLGQKLLHSKIIHISLGQHLILTTDSGQVYFGYFLNKGLINDTHTSNTQLNLSPQKVEVQSGSFTLMEIMENYKKERSECEEVNLVKIPLLYRSIKCFTDSKSRTFAVIQSDARIGLKKYPVVQTSKMTRDLKQMLASATLADDVHDAVIMVGTEKIPIHKFILDCRLNSNNLDIYKSNDQLDQKTVFQFPCTDSDVYTWLEKVYIGENTTTVPLKVDNKENSDDSLFAKHMSSFALVDFECPLDYNILNNGLSRKKKSKKKSAYAVYREKNKNVNTREKVNPQVSKDLVMLQTLDNWRNYKEVSDVTIESGDGCLFHCHKCVLTARAEYFSNMLSNTWIESSICKGGTLKIPIPGNVLDVVINYLYTDEANSLKETTDITFIGEVLVCADQLLLSMLKDICELELADKVSLKNAIEMFQFACDYNVEQLKTFMCEFLSLNLPYYLEARLLEDLSEEILHLFSKEYCEMVVGMETRKLKPSLQHRMTDELEKILQETVTNDLNKIKSKRGRLSLSKSKSLISTSESELEKSLCVHQLTNEVFEKISPSKINELNHTSEQQTRGIKSNVIQTDLVIKEVKRTSSQINGNLKNKSEFKSSKGDAPNGHKAWNVNQSMHSSHSSSEDPNNDEVTPKKVVNVTPFKKKSQKERKKERAQLSSVERDEESEIEEVEKSVCPWGNAILQTPEKSFREMLSEETIPSDERSPCKVKIPSFSQGSKKEKLSNPWRSPSTSECMDAESYGFASIVSVQQEEKKQLTERSKKPLGAIQREERAIEELLKHYQSKSTQGEYITIKRIKPVTSTPFWEVEIK